MRVAIAEDDEPYRLGLVELLTAADVTVAYQASSGPELLDYLKQGDRPDAVLLDIQMGGRRDDGVTTAEEISDRWPGLGILLLSNHKNDDLVRRFFAGGTTGRGYLLKEKFNDIEDVRHALDLVRRGKTFSDTAVLDCLDLRQLTIGELLTPRELGSTAAGGGGLLQRRHRGQAADLGREGGEHHPEHLQQAGAIPGPESAG